MIRFLTIREVADTGLLPEFCLRRMQKEGKLPGVFSGSRFYVDIQSLEQQLQAEALANAQGVTA